MLFFIFRYGIFVAQATANQEKTVNENTFGQDIGDIASDAAIAADWVSKGFDDLWEQTLNGQLYGAITNVGVLFAVGTLLIFMIQFGKALIEGEESKAIPELIWPLIVILLLGSHGKVLASGTMGLRNMINLTNQTVLDTVVASVRLQEAYQYVMKLNGDAEAIRTLQKQCEKISNPTQQKECYKHNQKEADKIVNSAKWNIFRRENPIERIKGIVNKIIRTPQSIAQNFLRIILFTIGYGYQWMIEISLLITALLGPLAVGGSLLPMAKRPIISWLTAMFSVGLAKLSYNLISGLVAVMMFNAPFYDPMLFPAIIGFFAPMLSVGLATGGGLSILNGITNIGSTVVKTAYNYWAFSNRKKSKRNHGEK